VRIDFKCPSSRKLIVAQLVKKFPRSPPPCYDSRRFIAVFKRAHPRSCVRSCCFLRWAVSHPPKLQVGLPLFGCPRLLIQYIRIYPLHLEPVSFIRYLTLVLPGIPCTFSQLLSYWVKPRNTNRIDPTTNADCTNTNNTMEAEIQPCLSLETTVNQKLIWKFIILSIQRSWSQCQEHQVICWTPESSFNWKRDRALG
jgi:hypothetical protein